MVDARMQAETELKEVRMTRKRRWFCGSLRHSSRSWPCPGTQPAPPTNARWDGATKRVEKGAKQIGQGQVGPGFKEMFTGVGQTVVEGAKFSGENIKEFFAGKK